jgi:hypothetical protein
VLRQGQTPKYALLYEVVAEETTEEGVSRRRRPQRPNQPQQLELVPSPPAHKTYRAAESSEPWGERSSAADEESQDD